MMKTFGLALVIVFCSAVGATMAGNLKKRMQALKKTQLFLHLLCERLSYTLSPVDEIFQSLAEEPLLKELDFIPLCSVRLAAHRPFPEAFRESVEKSRCALDRRDRAALCEACTVVGASGVEHQLQGLSLIRAHIAEQTRQAAEDTERRAKLYASLGVLSGVALAIVLV